MGDVEHQLANGGLICRALRRNSEQMVHATIIPQYARTTQNIGDIIMTNQQLINVAKAQVVAFNEKDWKKVKEIVTADFTYDEVTTHRKTEGLD